MSDRPRSRMPSASVTPDAPLERPAPRWGTAGLVLLGVWSALLAAAVALWVYAAFLSGSASADRGLVRLVGAPFVLVAVGLLWWAWRSARALRQGRREGWTLLLVLGGVAVMQAVLTAQAVLGVVPNEWRRRHRRRAATGGRGRPAGGHRPGSGVGDRRLPGAESVGVRRGGSEGTGRGIRPTLSRPSPAPRRVRKRSLWQPLPHSPRVGRRTTSANGPGRLLRRPAEDRVGGARLAVDHPGRARAR